MENNSGKRNAEAGNSSTLIVHEIDSFGRQGHRGTPPLACTQQGENRWENGVCEVFCSLVWTLQAAWWLFAMVGAVVYLIG